MNKTPLVLAALCLVVPSAEAMSKCIDRDGRCMEVTVNGKKAVKLAKQTKKILKDLEQVSDETRYARYELLGPISGALEIKADRSADSGEWFGGSRQFEAAVIPLGNVELETRQELTTAGNVKVAGGAPVVVQQVLESKRLPAGRYLLRITLNGTSNWDRMTLFFEVKD